MRNCISPIIVWLLLAPVGIAASDLTNRHGAVAQSVPDTATPLEMIRRRGDYQLQRRHAWRLFAGLIGDSVDRSGPSFLDWYGESDVFARTVSVLRGIESFSRDSRADFTLVTNDGSSGQSADPSVLTYTFYNPAAFDHIRANDLYRRDRLEWLQYAGELDRDVVGDRIVESFPRDAMVLKTVWWPVARAGLTALPVWDPDRNAARKGGNDYTSWKRMVAVEPARGNCVSGTADLNFAGRRYPAVRKMSLDAFFSIEVNARVAARLMRDAGARKSALMTLGRELEAGDYLVLVAANLASRGIDDWIWAAFWWHDQPDAGRFAADRPQAVRAPGRNYLMQVAFDFATPTAPDGGPHVCFNPWLEGRFPDNGMGGGTQSNCMACHRRASYPPVGFLPVTRGAPDFSNDPAYAPGRLRTGFLWSLALHSR